MPDVTYDVSGRVDPQELAEFYGRLHHETAASPEQLSGMVVRSAVFVTARAGGKLIGVARGVGDGVRGYLTECKLDPGYQGPAAVTRTDGRIEHDAYGIAGTMARKVLEALGRQGVERVDVLAWGTEVDFLEDLGFRRSGGLVGMTLRPGASTPPVGRTGAAPASV